MSQWEHTVSELNSLGNPSNYSFVFLPFPSHALGKSISYSGTSVSQLQFTSHTDTWLLTSIETTLIMKTQRPPHCQIEWKHFSNFFQHLRLWEYSFSEELFFHGFLPSYRPLLGFLRPLWHSSSGQFSGSLFHKCWCRSGPASHSLSSSCKLAFWWNLFTSESSWQISIQMVWEVVFLPYKHICPTTCWISPFKCPKGTLNLIGHKETFDHAVHLGLWHPSQ